MNCPACGRPLLIAEHEGMDLAVCQDGCGGAWFEKSTIRRLAACDETELQRLADAIRRNPGQPPPTRGRRSCPRCHGRLLQRRLSRKRPFEIGVCPDCSGVWLDHAEWSADATPRPLQERTAPEPLTRAHELAAAERERFEQEQAAWAREGNIFQRLARYIALKL